jgi:hypothetical protein
VRNLAPTVVAVDFTRTGELFVAVRELNGLAPRRGGGGEEDARDRVRCADRAFGPRRFHLQASLESRAGSHDPT